MKASMRAAALSSSESNSSRAGIRPFGSSTYSILNSPFIPAFEYYRIIAIARQVSRECQTVILDRVLTESQTQRAVFPFEFDVSIEKEKFLRSEDLSYMCGLRWLRVKYVSARQQLGLRREMGLRPMKAAWGTLLLRDCRGCVRLEFRWLARTGDR